MCGVSRSYGILNLWGGLMSIRIKLLLCLPHHACIKAYRRRILDLIMLRVFPTILSLPRTYLNGWFAYLTRRFSYIFIVIAIVVVVVLHYGLRKASRRLVFIILYFNCLVALKINGSTLLLLLLGVGMLLFLLLLLQYRIEGCWWLATLAFRWFIFA